MEQAYALLEGAYDLHVHTSPSIHPRKMNDFELLKQINEAKMGGAVIKSHYECTASRAKLVNDYMGTEAKLYGAMVVNQAMGGWNPTSVEYSLKAGAKIIFLPTNHAQNFFERSKNTAAKTAMKAEGMRAWDENGKIRSEIYEIIDLVKQFDAVFQTGHLGEAEAVAVAKVALARGAKVVLTHPDSPSLGFPLEVQLELAKAGAIIDKNERCLVTGRISAEELVAHLRLLNPQNCILTTDLGQPTAEDPVDGFALMVDMLLKAGVSEGDIRTMICTNPKKLLGLM